MTADRESCDALLGAVVAGERAEEDVEVQALLAARPELRQRLERLRALGCRLQAVGDQDRQLLRSSARESTPLEADVPAMLERARRRRHGRLGLTLLVAAALAVVAVVLVQRGSVPPAGGHASLGGSLPLGRIAPSGAITRDQVFGWNLPLPAGGRYVLRFYSGDAAGRLLFEVDAGDRQEWTLTPGKRAQMTPEMAWEVQVRDQVNVTVRTGGPESISAPR